MKKFFSGLIVTICLLSITKLTYAIPIQAPISVIANSMGYYNEDFKPEYTIDRSGLAPSYVPGVTDFATYISGNPTHPWAGSAANIAFASYHGSDYITGYIDYDMGTTLNFQQMALWNDMDVQAVQNFNLYVSGASDFQTKTLLGSFTAHNNTGTNYQLPAQVFTLANHSGRYIRFEITSNHGASDLTQFGEIAFGASNPVPEPASLLLLGSGLIGLAGFKKKKKKFFAFLQRLHD